MSAKSRFRMPLLLVSIVVLAAGLMPAGAQAAGLFVLSGSDSSDSAHSIPGLISLDDGGGEFQNSTSGGAVIAGTGVGPYVYNSGGSGSLSQFSGGTYRTITASIPSVKSMTNTGRGLVVAIGNKLQYVDSAGARSDVPHGTLTGGDSWVAIATAPNGHLIGWSWNNGWGILWDLNLATGETTSQDYTNTINDPLFNNRDNGSNGSGPIANAGGIAVDGTGGVWVANAEGDGTNAHIYHALPGGSLSLVTGGPSSYYKPHITATSDGNAYATTSDYSAPGYISDVYKISGANTDKVTLDPSVSKLANSALFDLAVDRCYTSCSVSLPGGIGGGGGSTQSPAKSTPPASTGTGKTGRTSSPLKAASKSLTLGKTGLPFKLTCKTSCGATVTGKLVFGKAKKKASAATANTLPKTKATLKAGKAKTLVLKLSKSQRKRIKRALKKKQKVTAELKVVIKPKGGKSSTKSFKLKVK